jgi:elongation factor G
MLDAVMAFLPSPYDADAIEGTNPDTEAVEVRNPNPEEPTAALAFKIASAS